VVEYTISIEVMLIKPAIYEHSKHIKGLFRCAFERSKNTFNTQKVYLKKKYLLVKKIESAFKGLKMKLLPKKTFFKKKKT
jgi:hypothetical protein